MSALADYAPVDKSHRSHAIEESKGDNEERGDHAGDCSALTWIQAAGICGITARQMRPMKRRYDT